MTKKVRRMLFILFVVAFLISAPIVVLYTAGYRYNFLSGRIVKTGVLSIKSVPKDATIILDGKEQKERTPAVLEDIFAGEHNIQIVKDGHTKWEKNLTVEEDETTFVEDAALFINDSPALILDQKIISVNKESGQAIYSIETSGWAELWLYSGNGEDDRLIARIPIKDAFSPVIEWSAFADYISVKSFPTESTSIIDLKTGDGLNLSELFENPTGGWWDIREDHVYFVKDGDDTFALDINSQSITPIGPLVSAASVEGDGFTVIQNVRELSIISRLDREGQSRITANVPIGNYKIVNSPGGILHLESEDGRLLILDLGGGNQAIRINEDFHEALWHPKGENLLLYTDGFSLNLYNAQSHQSETLTRFSSPIIDIGWDSEAQVVFYVQNNSVQSIELDSRDGRITNELANLEGLEQIWTNQDSLFILGESKENVSGIFERTLRK